MAFKPPRVYAVQLNTKNDDIDDNDDDVVQRFNVHLKLTSQPSRAHLAKVKTDMHAREKNENPPFPKFYICPCYTCLSTPILANVNLHSRSLYAIVHLSVCRLSVCRLSSVVCNVRATYSGD